MQESTSLPATQVSCPVDPQAPTPMAPLEIPPDLDVTKALDADLAAMLGDSLSAAEFAGLNTLSSLGETVEKLAARVDELHAQGSAEGGGRDRIQTDAPQALLANLDDLSDREVDEMLARFGEEEEQDP